HLGQLEQLSARDDAVRRLQAVGHRARARAFRPRALHRAQERLHLHQLGSGVMGRIVVSQFVTVDGVIEDPGGSEGFERGGWAFQFNRGEDGDKFKLDEVMESSALLLGRRTYEGFAAAWPTREGEFADKFNTMPKYVVSSTLSEPDWNNTTVRS